MVGVRLAASGGPYPHRVSIHRWLMPQHAETVFATVVKLD
jgi:hypothetical protein